MPLLSDYYFNDDSLPEDLGHKTASGGIVTMSGQGVRFVLQLGSTMVLARLLTPDDFGLIGMVMVVVGFLNMFKDFGLSQATIQRPNITHEEVSNLFWVNIAVSIFLTSCLWLCAPLIASFYGRVELTSLTVVLASFMILQGAGLQHRALITRKMEFMKLALVETGAMLVGVIVAVVLAYYSFSYWALVGQVGATALVSLIGFLVFCPWSPSKPSVYVSIRPYLKYGGNLAGFNTLNFFSRNADNIMIGYYLGASQLGEYSRAYQLLMFPIQQINAPLNMVMLPALSRLIENDKSYVKMYREGLRFVGYISIPAVVFCLIAAENIIKVTLGPKWLGVVPVFTALFPAALVGATNVATGWVFASYGHTDRQLRWAFLLVPVVVVSMFVGLHWGIIGVAVGFSLSWLLLRPFHIIYCFKGTCLRFRDFLIPTFRPFCVSCLAGVGAVFILQSIYGFPEYINLALLFFSYACIFLIIDVFLGWNNSLLFQLRKIKEHV